MPNDSVVPTSLGSRQNPTVDPREYSPSKKAFQVSDSVGTASDAKERYASRVATGITQTFTASCALILLGVFSILAFRKPEDAKANLEILIPVLKEVGLFLTSVFGPLLAFVLGY